jgi:hypothetical protein
MAPGSGHTVKQMPQAVHWSELKTACWYPSLLIFEPMEMHFLGHDTTHSRQPLHSSAVISMRFIANLRWRIF